MIISSNFPMFLSVANRNHIRRTLINLYNAIRLTKRQRARLKGGHRIRRPRKASRLLSSYIIREVRGPRVRIGIRYRRNLTFLNNVNRKLNGLRRAQLFTTNGQCSRFTNTSRIRGPTRLCSVLRIYRVLTSERRKSRYRHFRRQVRKRETRRNTLTIFRFSSIRHFRLTRNLTRKKTKNSSHITRLYFDKRRITKLRILTRSMKLSHIRHLIATATDKSYKHSLRQRSNRRDRFPLTMLSLENR